MWLRHIPIQLILDINLVLLGKLTRVVHEVGSTWLILTSLIQRRRVHSEFLLSLPHCWINARVHHISWRNSHGIWWITKLWMIVHIKIVEIIRVIRLLLFIFYVHFLGPCEINCRSFLIEWIFLFISSKWSLCCLILVTIYFIFAHFLQKLALVGTSPWILI